MDARLLPILLALAPRLGRPHSLLGPLPPLETRMKKEPAPKGDKMKLVLCPRTGRREWANLTKKEGYRCCKCGLTH